MELLILGGSRFVGRAVAEAAVSHGWRVTTFNRGMSGPDVPGVQAVRGDRDRCDDVKRLRAMGRWDAVVDTSAYVPRDTLQLAETLKPVTGRYLGLSTVSVYEGWPVTPLSESSPTLECPVWAGPDWGPPDVEDGPTRYGRLKIGCEAAAAEMFGPDLTTMLRPGVILGPGEYVGRLPWWLTRVSVGGRILAPGRPDRSIQPIDVRDVADFVLHLVGEGRSGVFNVAAPIGRDTFGGLLTACAEATGAKPTFRWVSDQQLLAFGVRQWSELPLWRTFDGVWRVDSTSALAAGLQCRPLTATVKDTWSWMQEMGVGPEDDRALELGLSPDREQQILSLAG